MHPITDLFNRIKNAQSAGHGFLSVPASKEKMEILAILKAGGFIKDFEKKGRTPQKTIEITSTTGGKKPESINFKIISKPGQRIYAKKGEIAVFKKYQGLVIISTSRGLLTDKEAKKRGLGGEVIVEIWA